MLCLPSPLPVNTFLPVFTSIRLWWMCIALPGSFSIGLARKVAYTPWRIAASRIIRLNMNTWSARDIASAWVKLTSNCAAPDSWISVSTSNCIASL